jgi:hypothetical protein
MIGPYGDVEPECRFCHGMGIVAVMDGYGLDIPGLLDEYSTGETKPCPACNEEEELMF